MTIESARAAAALSAEEIRQKVAEFEWYHTIDLGGGILTPGQYDLAPLIDNYGIPESLAGKSVLDVGPAHGFFAFEFEKRGAERVVTSELPNWTDHDGREHFDQDDPAFRRDEEYHRGAFGFAIQARRSRVERCFCSVYDLTPERIGMFDLVFCASVLLHLTDPLRALYGIRRVCRGQAIVCTGIDTHLLVAEQNRALFVGTPDGHAFWLPTMTCLEQMAIAAGFARVERVSTFRLKSKDGLFNTPHGTIRALVA
jgi:tRNA (mo5U34)-methyltransferase